MHNRDLNFKLRPLFQSAGKQQKAQTFALRLPQRFTALLCDGMGRVIMTMWNSRCHLLQMFLFLCY